MLWRLPGLKVGAELLIVKAVVSYLAPNDTFIAHHSVSTELLTVITPSFDEETLIHAAEILTTDGRRSLASYAGATQTSPLSSLGYYVPFAADVYTYTAIVYFSVRIWLRLRTSMAMLASNSRLREVNKQLNRVLTAQALVPLAMIKR